jgi:membrane associated rhomboid family serine protease
VVLSSVVRSVLENLRPDLMLRKVNKQLLFSVTLHPQSCTPKLQQLGQTIMGAIGSVLWQGISCPVTTVLILATCWVWVKLFIQDWDPRHVTVTYTDVAQKKQYWRIFTAPLAHTSILLLLVNASLIWSIRTIETNYGSLFVLRYTAVLIISESLIACTVMYILMRTLQNSDLRQLVSSTTTLGSSGLILSWLAFQSVTFSAAPVQKYVVLFGYFNVHPALAPLVIIFLYCFILPAGYSYSNFGALISGYLLAAGLLQVLPGFFWSACFLVDVALIVAVSVLFRESGATAAPAAGELRIGDTLEVVEIGPASLTDGGLPTSSDLRDLLGFGRRSTRQNPPPQRAEDREDREATEEEILEEGEFYGSESTPLLQGSDAGGGVSGAVRDLLAAERARDGAHQLPARRSNSAFVASTVADDGISDAV